MSGSTESFSSSRIPRIAIDVWIEDIISQIACSFSEEQLEAWNAGTTVLRAPIRMHSPMKFWGLDVRDEKFEIPFEIDRNRGNGKTYYIACLYIIWCLRNPGLWIYMHEFKVPSAYHNDTSLFVQVRELEEKYLASTPFALEIRNGDMIRGIARKD